MEKQTVTITRTDKKTGKTISKEYEIVASRVLRFWDENKEWSIESELISYDEKKVIMKTTIKDKTGRIRGTGHAEEIRSASYINSTSAMECAETSSIGRALACIGYIGGEFASADEVANAISQQNNQKTINTAWLKVTYTEEQKQFFINELEKILEENKDLISDENKIKNKEKLDKFKSFEAADKFLKNLKEEIQNKKSKEKEVAIW